MPTIHQLKIAALLWVLAPVAATAAQHIATEKFAALPTFDNVRLSPAGTRLAAINHVDEETFTGAVVFVRDMDSGQQYGVTTAREGEYRIQWIRWANERHLLVSLAARVVDQGVPFTATRLIVVDTQTRENHSILGRGLLRKAAWTPQFQDRIVDILPDDEEHILLATDLREPGNFDVYRINLKTRKAKLEKKGRAEIRSWITDRQHRVRIGVSRDDGVVKIYEQDIEGKNWRTLWRYDQYSEDLVDPMGFGVDPNDLYVNAYHEGRLAIFRVDLSDPDLTRELVFSDARLDIEGDLVYSRKSKEIIGIRTGLDDGYEFWSEEHRGLVDRVNKSLEGTYNHIVSMTADERQILYLSQSDTDAGTYYLFLRDEERLAMLARRYDFLQPDEMAETSVVRYQARDGVDIQAFVTLPRDTEAKNLPAIIYPHGGPIAYAGDGFDYWAQMFANRGYAVMQMNFRGSAGYGYDFMASGLQSWGLEMQDDVTDATSWLVEQGIADPERICIVGGSYGGYAALMGAVKTPDLFRCAVSFAGVSDLFVLLASSRKYANAEAVAAQLGNRRSDLKARSPATGAENVEIPVLLIHGDKDVVVPVRHSRIMYRALQKHDKPVTYIEQKGGNHYLTTSAQRREALVAIDAFLAEHLGPP